MKVALAQFKFSLGDFKQNTQKVLQALKKAQAQADLIVFPEGGLWGYPPKDFLYQETYFQVQQKMFQQINKQLAKGVGLILPGFHKSKTKLQNGAFFLEKNKKPLFFAKEFLPDQEVFFESRYFEKGCSKNNSFYWKKKKIQLLICEDLWKFSPKKPADLIIAVNASPYTDQKQKKRLKRTKQLVKYYNSPLIYLNLVGAQDSLIFDGGSFLLNAKGQLIWQAPFFKSDFQIVDPFQKKALNLTEQKKLLLPLQKQREQALILGIKEFFLQTGFKQAVIGLSGGIDSALTVYLALQALGKNNIKAFFLPSPYTSELSRKINRQLAKNLNITLVEKNITPLLKTFTQSFFKKAPPTHSLAFQNAQTRLRTLILMAVANETSSLLLSTSNKSELAMGYSTLYGDLAGAIAPLGDLLKSEVYELARFINKKRLVFPKELLSREPTAELAPKQKDSDDLPPYNQLDPLLKRILRNETLKSSKEKELAQLIQKQEFKRTQAPPILKISEYDLGESWKRPIAHNFKP